MIRSTILRLAAASIALAAPVTSTYAADLPPEATERVAASVNEEAVTIHDLDARVRLGLLSANLQDTAENRQRLGPEVLRRLIDERLEAQEAKRLKVGVADSEVAFGISDIEKQNNMQKGQLGPYLEDHGIDPQTLRDQIRTQLVWNRLVREELLPTIHVGEEEIDARLAQMKDGLTKPAYLAADIYLPVDDPARDDQVHQLADSLVQQLASGAPFSQLARQFSQSGAATGGDLGWISPGMLDDQLMDALSKLELHHASSPIRTRDGYHILLLRDKHDAGQILSSEPTMDMAQIDLVLLPGSSDQERQSNIDKLKKAVEKASSCDDYEKSSGKIPTAHFSRIGLLRPSDMPVEIRGMINPLKKGEMTGQPFTIGDTKRFFIVCARTEATNGLPSREEVRRRIENERLELLSVRYLRDLRRRAFVEIRI
ncbi:MAG TPA: peptidylprolyl isomerase [Magnetospirillaceae bacterium]|jgi:peptidyl-prolyl cis-trans isomerase SurA